jgi:hypothetical protein
MLVISQIHSLLSEFPNLQSLILSFLQVHPEPLWRGIWSLEQSEAVANSMKGSVLSANNWQKGHALMDKLTKTLTTGALHMHAKYKTPHPNSHNRTLPSNSSQSPPTTLTSLTTPPLTHSFNSISPSVPLLTPLHIHTIEKYFHPAPPSIHSHPITPLSNASHKPSCKDQRNKRISSSSSTPQINSLFPVISSNLQSLAHPDSKLHHITHVNTQRQRLSRLDEFHPSPTLYSHNISSLPAHPLTHPTDPSSPNSIQPSDPQEAGPKPLPAERRNTRIVHPDCPDSYPITCSLLSPHAIPLSCNIRHHPSQMPHSCIPTLRSTPTSRTRPAPKQGAILALDPLNVPHCTIAYCNITPPVTCSSSQTIPPSLPPSPFISPSSSSTPPSPSIT